MKISYDFDGMRYVVTGASSGIGRRVAADLAAAGASVLALARRAEALNELAAEYPGAVVPVATDVTDFRALQSAVADFGQSGAIDGSVHAAGVNQFTPLRGLRWDAVEALIRTNLFAAIELVRLLSSRRFGADGSSHVQIASVHGMRGQAGLAAYSASKAAMIGSVRALARELAPRGVRVNAVSPGWVRTPMAERMEAASPGLEESLARAHPLGFGDPGDVSGAVLFLLSDAGRWITGANMVVDGGYSS